MADLVLLLWLSISDSGEQAAIVLGVVLVLAPFVLAVFQALKELHLDRSLANADAIRRWKKALPGRTFYKISYLAMYPQTGEGLTSARTVIEQTVPLGAALYTEARSTKHRAIYARAGLHALLGKDDTPTLALGAPPARDPSLVHPGARCGPAYKERRRCIKNRSSIITTTIIIKGITAMVEQSVKGRVYAAAERISTTTNPTVATVREAAGVSNADAGRYLKEWRAERDSAGSKIAATPPIITEQAMRLTGTVWAEAVRTATAEHVVVEKAWREEAAHKDREINELANDLDTAANTHKEDVAELQAKIGQAEHAASDSAAAASTAREQLAAAARQLAEENAGFTSQLAEARATIATLQKTQDALIARIQPPGQ